jgi:predicted RNase H-like nuclease (RuvC/YqgF family)
MSRKESEIGKLKDQIAQLDSINNKIEENYKKLLNEKCEQLESECQNSKLKDRQIADFKEENKRLLTSVSEF